MYCVLGYACLVGTAFVLEQAGLLLQTKPALVLAPLLLAPAFLAFRQRVKVDHSGISRRRFFGWDLWPWEAFAGGKIRQGASKNSFVYPTKPWGNRRLTFEFLSEEDQELVRTLIAQVWKPPEPPVPPEEITIHFGLGGRARFSRDGVEVWRWKRADRRFFSCGDVQEVRMRLPEHGSREFTLLELVLIGRKSPMRLYRGIGQAQTPKLWCKPR
jgi:hypothetical protein